MTRRSSARQFAARATSFSLSFDHLDAREDVSLPSREPRRDRDEGGWRDRRNIDRSVQAPIPPAARTWTDVRPRARSRRDPSTPPPRASAPHAARRQPTSSTLLSLSLSLSRKKAPPRDFSRLRGFLVLSNPPFFSTSPYSLARPAPAICSRPRYTLSPMKYSRARRRQSPLQRGRYLPVNSSCVRMDFVTCDGIRQA